MTREKTSAIKAWQAMVSPDYNKYEHIVRWPDLKMVKQKSHDRRWHFKKPIISCLKGPRISYISGEATVYKVYIIKSLEKNKLYMLDKNGNEVNPADICEECAANVMKLLRWSDSDDGRLEIQQQESRDEYEERDFRAKGLLE